MYSFWHTSLATERKWASRDSAEVAEALKDPAAFALVFLTFELPKRTFGVGFAPAAVFFALFLTFGTPVVIADDFRFTPFSLEEPALVAFLAPVDVPASLAFLDAATLDLDAAFDLTESKVDFALAPLDFPDLPVLPLAKAISRAFVVLLFAPDDAGAGGALLTDFALLAAAFVFALDFNVPAAKTDDDVLARFRGGLVLFFPFPAPPGSRRATSMKSLVISKLNLK